MNSSPPPVPLCRVSILMSEKLFLSISKGNCTSSSLAGGHVITLYILNCVAPMRNDKVTLNILVYLYDTKTEYTGFRLIGLE